MKTPDISEEIPERPEQRDYLTVLADLLKSRLQAGEIVGALDYPESDRPLFHGAIAGVRDDMPWVRSIWRTISEQHVDGLRTRQKLFRICPRQKGLVDATLAGRCSHWPPPVRRVAGWRAAAVSKPSTLMSITNALGDIETLTGIRIVQTGAFHLFVALQPGRFTSLDWKQRLEIRFALEAAGFRPVSAKLLDEALSLAKFPQVDRTGNPV